MQEKLFLYLFYQYLFELIDTWIQSRFNNLVIMGYIKGYDNPGLC